MRTQTFEHYELEKDRAKLIIKLPQQQKLDVTLLKKLLQNNHFREILVKLLEHNLLTGQIIDSLNKDFELCEKIYPIKSAKVIYLLACDERKDYLKNLKQIEKLTLHEEIVESKEIINAYMGNEKYQQILDELSDSILEEIHNYTVAKKTLVENDPDGYERKVFGLCFFGKHKTNKAKSDANIKAKEVFENYLKSKEAPNPYEFFNQKTNETMLRSLQQGKSNDISKPLFAYAAKSAAPAA